MLLYQSAEHLPFITILQGSSFDLYILLDSGVIEFWKAKERIECIFFRADS
jgi:hypothetical protein